MREKAVNPRGQVRQILIVDDHPIVREGLSRLLGAEDDLSVCAEVGESAAALAAVNSMPVDLAVVDLVLGDEDGLILVDEMTRQAPDVPVLVLSMRAESVFAERALRAGARGYVMKEESGDVLLEAVRYVLAGEVYLSEGMRRALARRLAGVDAVAPMDSLTNRELAVFQLIGRGLSTRKIASKLGLSPKTIETYREHLKQKLGLKDGIELTQKAALWMQQPPAP